jgi:energy-coupling factor transport system substrate-specific component
MVTIRAHTVLAALILALASLLGVGAFLSPFFVAQLPGAGTGMMAHAADAPLMFVLLLVLCLIAVMAGMTGQQMTSKMVALLGVMTALSAALRALPGPGGFSAVFLLPILAGYCYGPAFGFLLGAMCLLVSALIGGGVGPWLPYQMFATGWVGLLSGWLPDMSRRPAMEPFVLAAWGALLGLVFGAIMNLWFWPYLAPLAAGAANAGPAMVAGSSGGSWQPGMALWATMRSYLLFYLATSLWWDLARAAGNALLLVLFARPILRVLRRFRGRFRFEVLPEPVLIEDAK